MKRFGNPLTLYNSAPTRAAADTAFDQRIAQGVAGMDANDFLLQFEASEDYNPAPQLDKIKARVLAINTADDTVNPPELGVMEKQIMRVPKGKYLLLPRSSDTIGHSSYRIGKLYKQAIVDALKK